MIVCRCCCCFCIDFFLLLHFFLLLPHGTIFFLLLHACWRRFIHRLCTSVGDRIHCTFPIPIPFLSFWFIRHTVHTYIRLMAPWLPLRKSVFSHLLYQSTTNLNPSVIWRVYYIDDGESNEVLYSMSLPLLVVLLCATCLFLRNFA